MSDLDRLAELNQKLAELSIDSEMFRQIINVLPDGLIVIDDAGEIHLVNQQMELLFGYPRSMLIGESIDILLTSETALVHSRHLEKFFAYPTARPMNLAKVLPARHRSGRLITVQISIGPLISETGVKGLALIRRVADAN